MKKWIERFIDGKKLSLNSEKSYRYDLRQFDVATDGRIDQESLLAYQQSLADLKPTAQKRKQSAVNQFLYFLYERGAIEHFYRLQTMEPAFQLPKQYKKEDLSLLFLETSWERGQLIALLIAFLGLTPSELARLESCQVNLDFQVVTVQKGNEKRVLALPKELIPYLSLYLAGRYVFDKKGQPYSRQWLFKRLREFVESIEKPDWTAQKLREQYILAQIEKGWSLEQIAKQLGLKTSMSLEKFR